MKLIYFYLFPLSFPLCLLFVLFLRLVLPCYFGGGCVFPEETTTGYVTRGLKDGPSRHPEKVHPQGEGDERGGR